MAKRSAPEVNAGSMADIAFLLLIFFLVTTTLEKDNGIARQLPPIDKSEIEPPKIKEKNLFIVLVNKNDQLLVNDSPMELEDLRENAIEFFKIGEVVNKGTVTLKNNEDIFNFDISSIRDTWFKTSYLLDQKQTSNGLAEHRFKNFKKQPLQFKFPSNFSGKLPKINSN